MFFSNKCSFFFCTSLVWKLHLRTVTYFILGCPRTKSNQLWSMVKCSVLLHLRSPPSGQSDPGVWPRSGWLARRIRRCVETELLFSCPDGTFANPFHWQKVFSSSTPPKIQNVLWGRGITRGLTFSICAAVWMHKYRGQLFTLLNVLFSLWTWWLVLYCTCAYLCTGTFSKVAVFSHIKFLVTWMHIMILLLLVYCSQTHKDQSAPKSTPKNPLYAPLTGPPSVLLMYSLLLRKQVACWLNPGWQTVREAPPRPHPPETLHGISLSGVQASETHFMFVERKPVDSILTAAKSQTQAERLKPDFVAELRGCYNSNGMKRNETDQQGFFTAQMFHITLTMDKPWQCYSEPGP